MTENKTVRFAEIANELAELYARKNSDYGDSFGKTYKEFKKFSDNCGNASALTRMADKMNRITQLLLNDQPQKVKDEKITDTLRDLASYSIMLLIELENEKKERGDT